MVHGTPYANSPAIDLEPPNKTTTKQATREENAGLVLNANTNRYTRVSLLIGILGSLT